MRYEDTTQAGGIAQGHGPNAENDLDALTAGSRTPAMGNVITGDGTKSGAAGADDAVQGHIISIAGKGGEDSSFVGGKLTAEGDYGKLTIDADGNYRYVPHNNVPENSLDRFVYTLADGSGGHDAAVLTIEFGKTQTAVKANAQQVVPGPDGVVMLPAGVDLSDVHVVGRNLVIDLPDGSQMVIIDGAVFVPQLSLDGVDVPSTNLAALLIGSEPKPAAGGEPPSSGGNFEVPVPPLDPGVPLGDLIPPTEYHYTPPEVHEEYGILDHQPTVTITPNNGVAVQNAVDQVNEAGLPAREGEPEGSNAPANSETTTGTINIDSPDGPSTVTIDGVVINAVGQVIHGQYGDLTITSISGTTIGYSYTLNDNTNGDNTHDAFAVVVTDVDGDTANASLTIDIIDDVPTARNDLDNIDHGGSEATGNVITGDSTVGGTSGSGVDTVGADDATLIAIKSVNVSGNASSTDEGGNLVIHGQYGVLTIDADGNYSYVRNDGAPVTANDVFTYTLKDGDGDESSATLTIHIQDAGTSLDLPVDGSAATIVSESGLPPRSGEPGEPAGTGEAADHNPNNNSDGSEKTVGVISYSAPDGPATVTINGTAVTGVIGQQIVGAHGFMTITSYNATTGQIGYSYTLTDNTSGDTTTDNFAVVVTDADGDHSDKTLTIHIVDDVPVPATDHDSVAAGTYGPETGNVVSGEGTTEGLNGAGWDNVGADNASVTAIASDNDSESTSTVGEDGSLIIHGQYGVLTIDADGNYSYVRDAGTPGGVTDSFTYTLTDGDGDARTAHLIIDIKDSDTSLDLPTGEESGTLVSESGLPTRGSEPAGSGEAADHDGGNNSDGSESTSGTISYTAPDGPATITIQGKDGPVTVAEGVTIHGQYGDMVINTYNPDTHQITYTYTLLDNTSGDATHDDFAVVVTDVDGDHTNGTLTINIVDDVPVANNDSDTIAGGGNEATGNVISGDSTDGGLNGSGWDNVGADNATVVAISSNNEPGNGSSVAEDGGMVIHGEYGVLTIYADGHYDYVRNDGTPGNVDDVFTYTLKDGDTDTDTATLTIHIQDSTPNLDKPAVVQLDDDGVLGAGGNDGGPGDDPNSVNATGTLAGSGGDGALTYGFSGTNTLPSGFTVSAQPNGDLWIMQGATHVMTVTLDTATGAYEVTQVHAIDHPTLNDVAGDNTENNLTFDIGVKVTDTDGDTNSPPVSLTINVDDDTPTVRPTVNPEAGLSVDESGPTADAAINTGLIVKGDDPNVTGSGAIAHDSSGSALVDLHPSFGADGPAAGNPIHYELNVTNTASGLTLTDGSAINLVELSNGVVVGVVQGSGAFAGQAAFAIQIDPTTGVVTIEQYLSLDHPVDTNPNDALTLAAGSLAVVGTATDHDGDTISSGNVDVSGQFHFLDDGPSVAPTVHAEATVTVDESLPSTTPTLDTGDIQKGDDPDLPGGLALGHSTSGVAIVDPHAAFGADGPAVGGGIAYALTITNQASGLTLTDGSAIQLEMVNGVIVGVVQGGTFDGQAALAIAIDPSTGVVTVEQYLSLDHPVNPNPNDPLGLGDNTVGVTVTVTDGDGDHVTSDAVDVSHQITFLDDGPTVAPTVNANATISVDESLPSTDPTIVLVDHVAGNDPDLAGGLALGHATSGVAIVDPHAAFGADGPAAGGGVSYALTILSAPSGLTLTDGTTISLVMDHGVVVGVVDSGSFAGQAAFAIAIDPTTGVVTLEQYLSLHNPDAPNNYDEIVQLANNTIGVTVTVTDGDGDAKTSDAVDVSHQFSFHDDGPKANNDTGTQSAENADVTVNVFTNDNGGADGALASSVALVAGSLHVTAGQTAGTITNNGDGTFTYHPSAGQTGTVTFDYTITDGDGDKSQATVTINLTADSVPQPTNQHAYSDDDGLANANTTVGSNDIDANQGETPTTNPSEAVYNGQLVVNFGSDTPGVIGFANLNGTNGTVGTETVSYSWNAGTNTLTATTVGGSRPGTVLFDIHMTNPATGEYVLTQHANILQAPPASGNGDETSAPDVVLHYQAVDSDNSSSTAGTLTITFNDDVPTLTNVGSNGLGVTLDETDGAIAGAAGGMTPISMTSLSAVITATQAFGADGAQGPAVYGLSLLGGAGVTSLASGLQTAVGDYPITLNLVDSTHITGTYNGANTAFTITMNANGTISVTLNVPLEHLVDGSTTAAYDDPLNLGSLVNGTITITDGDGDKASAAAAIGNLITFEDDGPSITVSKGADAGVTLATQDADTIGVATDHASSSANFGGVFSLTSSGGADGAASAPVLTYTLGVSSSGVDSGLDSHGANIYLYTISGVVVGSTSSTQAGVTTGNTIFDVTVSSTGVVTLDQFQQIDHPAASDPTPGGAPYADQSISMLDSLITLTGSSTITDNDGDTASSSQTVNIGSNLIFQDDGPVASVNGSATLDTLVLDESRPVGSDTTGGAAPTGLATVTANFADNFTAITSASYGADGAGSTAYSLVLSGTNVASGLYALQSGDTSTVDGDGYGQGAQIVLNQVGNTITGSVGSTNYFTITVDPSTGVVTFTQLANIWHGTTTNDDDTSVMNAALNAVVIRQTVTDFDGDTATANIDLSKGVFQIQDDGPEAYTPNAVHATNGDTAPVIANLNLHMGTDGLGQLLFSNEYEGDPATDSDGHALLMGGQPLYYHVVGNILTATTAVGGGGSLGFTVTLNSNGTYTFDVNGTISNGTETSFTNLTSAAAGNVNYRGVGADSTSNNTGNTDLLLSASNGASIATVNTNSTAVGSGNQSMNAGESVRIDFVTNMTSGGGATGFNYGAHVDTNSYEQKIPQVQGSQTATVAIHVWALDSNLTAAGVPDSSPSGGFSDATSTTITTVTVTDYATLVESAPVDISAVAVGVWTTVAFGVSVQKQGDGSVIFSGLQEGDSYSIGTGSNHFNAVVVQGVATGTGPAGNLSTTDGFDLGILSIGSVSASTPIVQNFNIVAIDGDGDPQTGVISTTIDPVTTTLAAKTMVAASEPVADSLLATNDNSSSNHDHGNSKSFGMESRLAQSANTNSFAVAAAVVGAVGLEASAAAAQDSHQAHDASATAMAGGATSFTAFAADAGEAAKSVSGSETGHMVKAAVTDASAAGADNGNHGEGLAGAVADHSQQVSQLAAPTDAGHAAPDVSTFVAPMVAMASAEMVAAANLTDNVQKAGQVDKVLVDALADHGGAKIDQLLQAATGHGGGDGVAKLAGGGASPDAGHVQAWDSAMAMGSHAAEAMMFKADASMLHHDAIQPTVHG